MQEQQVVTSVFNAMRAAPETAMTVSLINSVRTQQPVLYNRALSQFNNWLRQNNRSPSTRWEPVQMVQGAQATQAAPVAQAAQVTQTVNTQQPVAAQTAVEGELVEELDELNYNEFDEEVVDTENAAELIEEDDESIEDEDTDVADEESIAELEEEDFEDDAELLEDANGAIDDTDEHFDNEFPVEEIPVVENISFKHSLSLSLFLNSEQGAVFQADNGKYYTSKQPLRRGSGAEKDATGSVRASLENFIDGVKAEGEGIRFAVAVPDNVLEDYVRKQNGDIEARLSSTFDPESGAYVAVTSTMEPTENPWGGNNARIVHREIELRFAIPAIVSAAVKGKDEVKMLESNLKIVNNLVRTLKESANVENVQVHILIEDAVTPNMMAIFAAIISEGNVPAFDRGYARFTVQSDDAIGGEIEQ